MRRQMRRITVQSQPGQIVCEISSGKNPPEKRASGVVQGEFKPQYHIKKEKTGMVWVYYTDGRHTIIADHITVILYQVVQFRMVVIVGICQCLLWPSVQFWG
jgi:hypothetical protein